MDPKITSLIEAMHDNVECAVVINGQLTELFRVEIGVRQGCLLSPILFSLFMELISLHKLFSKPEELMHGNQATYQPQL